MKLEISSEFIDNFVRDKIYNMIHVTWNLQYGLAMIMLQKKRSFLTWYKIPSNIKSNKK